MWSGAARAAPWATWRPIIIPFPIHGAPNECAPTDGKPAGAKPDSDDGFDLFDSRRAEDRLSAQGTRF